MVLKSFSNLKGSLILKWLLVPSPGAEILCFITRLKVASGIKQFSGVKIFNFFSVSLL